MLERVLALLVGAPFAVAAGMAPSGDEGRVAFTFADPDIVESSGLVARDGLFVTTNDSGDAGRVFIVDPADGRTVGRTSWTGDPQDAEALAPAGPGAVWVGDIGDNLRRRDSVEVLRVPVGRGELDVEPERYRLTYPDGARDAETLLAHPRTGRLVVVSKEVLGGIVYRAPRTLDPAAPNRLQDVGRAVPVATDGAFLPDGRHLVLRSYSVARVLTWPALEVVGSFDLPRQDQGEGIAVDEEGRVFVSSEGVGSQVLAVDLPADVRRALRPAGQQTTAPDGGDTGSDDVAAAPAGDVRRDDARSDDPLGGPARPAWPWFLAAWVGVVAVALAVRRRRH